MKKLTCRLVAYLPVLVSVSALLMTCKQKDPLPYATQSGQNTLGCMINGKPYGPDGGGEGWSDIKPVDGGLTVLQSTPHKIGVHFSAYAKDKQSIVIFLNDYTLGQHLLNTTTQTWPAPFNRPSDYGQYWSSSGEPYVTSSRYTGQVTIVKADTTTGIVAGTFEFTAATQDGKIVTHY